MPYDDDNDGDLMMLTINTMMIMKMRTMIGGDITCDGIHVAVSSPPQVHGGRETPLAGLPQRVDVGFSIGMLGTLRHIGQVGFIIVVRAVFSS